MSKSRPRAPAAARPAAVLLAVLAALISVLGTSAQVAAQRAAPEAGNAGVNGLNVKTVTFAGGMYRLENPKHWVEEGDQDKRFNFVEEKRDDTSVDLLDPGRDLRIRLDLRQRQIWFAQGKAQFARLYPIVSASAAATPARSAGQKCQDAVQGKVAWNREGNRSWRPDDLRQLCSSTTLTAKTVECFQKELNAQGDSQRAIRSCTEGRHRVQVLYVIPRGQQARPDAEKALEAIMVVVQRHFFQQLGVTFQLKTPLVSVVRIDETIDQLKGGDAQFARANKLAAGEFKGDHEYKENLILTVFEGADTGMGVGGGNVVSIPGDFWRPAYEMFKQSPADLPKVKLLHGWSHELGHAFGLAHTEDARKCFALFGVDLGPLPSLIMQKKEDRPTLYDYPFIPQEKRLLLDETYYPLCRPTLGNRPHGHWHLQHPLPPETALVRPAAAGAAGAPPGGSTAGAVSGLNVTTVIHSAGSYRMIGPGRWLAENKSGNFNFAEEKRDETSVLLFDRDRNFRVRIDLKLQEVLLSQGGADFRPLFKIERVSAAGVGAAVQPTAVPASQPIAPSNRR